MKEFRYLGPIKQLLTFADISQKGPVQDDEIQIIMNAGILFEDEKIKSVGKHGELLQEANNLNAEIIEVDFPAVALPAFIDAHTHICFAGSRAGDYALRNAGSSYLEIAKAGGGIWQTVTDTRKASGESLSEGVVKRAKNHLKNGVATIEVKSGYGLTVEEEVKMLRSIHLAARQLHIDLMPTCLAAHVCPRDFSGSNKEYLAYLLNDLLPDIKRESLANRVDIFIEDGAFTADEGRYYLEGAQSMGFEITVHADQFSTGGSALAIEMGALSADHLEASGSAEIKALASSSVTGIALPGASLGLGCPFTPARELLDAGGSLAIASDHNPGSAPMGQLVTQAAILGSFQKLTNAEVLSGITFRAANALGLKDRGRLVAGQLGDVVLYKTGDYRDILYYQGSLKPDTLIKKSRVIYTIDD